MIGSPTNPDLDLFGRPRNSGNLDDWTQLRDWAAGGTRPAAIQPGLDAYRGRQSSPGWNWYDDPGFSQYGMGRQPARGAKREGPEVPEWARSVYGDDYAAFYQQWQSLSPEGRLAMRNSLMSQYAAAEADREAREAALGTLDERMNALAATRDAWLQNSTGRTIEDTLQQQASGAMPTIGPAQVNAMNLGLGQTGATAARDAALRAAARGAEFGGAAAARQTGINAQTDAARIQLGAQVEAANVEGRQRALDALGRYDIAREDVTQGYESALSGLAGTAAAIKNGAEFIPSDVNVFNQLDWARQQYERFLVERDRDEQFAREASEESLLDIGTFLFDILSNGGLRMIGNVWESFTGGPR